MEKDIDPDIIKATQNSLGKHVKRPPLSEKLLKKPPFRFLHDIVTTTLKTTGFFDGLFDDGELISENVKDRESKLLFLNKVIAVLGKTTGKSIAAKPSKIVAGQEPEKTNELLQCLAYALDNKLSSHDAVKIYKDGAEKPTAADKSDKKTKEKEQGKVLKKPAEDKRLNSKSNEKVITQKKDPKDRQKSEKINTNSIKTKLTKVDSKDSISKKESLPKNNKPLKTKEPGAEKVAKDRNKVSQEIKENVTVIGENNVKEENPTVDKVNTNGDFIRHIQSAKHEDAEDNTNNEDQGVLSTSYVIAPTDLNSSLSSQDLMEVEPNKKEDDEIQHANIINETSLQIQNPTEKPTKQQQRNSIGEKTNISRQNSTEKTVENSKVIVSKQSSISKDQKYSVGDDTVKDKQDNKPVRPVSVRPSSSRPGAPRLREKHENVVAGNDTLIIGKVNIIQETNSIEEEEDTSIMIVDSKADEVEDNAFKLTSNQHGHLVQQILESSKEFSQSKGKTEIEWQFDALKSREVASEEVDKIRVNIQALSRVANPLGKLLDHIQEDVEVMRQELQQWTKTYEETSKELLKHKTANDESLMPLHSKIKQLEVDIEEKRDKINDLKVIIHKNASRIDKLLASGNGNVQ